MGSLCSVKTTGMTVRTVEMPSEGEDQPPRIVVADSSKTYQHNNMVRVVLENNLICSTRENANSCNAEM